MVVAEGGCIDSPHTHNIWDPALIEKRFFPSGHTMVEGKQRVAIIFHCEFSSKRAPKMCRHLRTLDRQIGERINPLQIIALLICAAWFHGLISLTRREESG